MNGFIILHRKAKGRADWMPAVYLTQDEAENTAEQLAPHYGELVVYQITETKRFGTQKA